jgi:ribose transport system ATP-binding protein
MAGTPVLEAHHIGKCFGTVTVLDDISLEVHAGEVLAVMGENGAGKSTLMKIMAGVQSQTNGTLSVDGLAAQFDGTRDAERAGIAIIHQELHLVEELSVAANIFLGREPKIAGLIINQRAMTKAADALLLRLGVSIDSEARAGGLRIGEQQMVEIAKALSLDARVLIMDEPTSALSTAECATLFKVIEQLTAAGVAIIYISHRMDEVMLLADRVMVLRDGRHVLTAPIAALSRDDIINAMIGRALNPDLRSRALNTNPVMLSVRDLWADGTTRKGSKRVVDGVSFDVRAGEVFGIAGLLGSGRTEILETIFSAASDRVSGGAVTVAGRPVTIAGPEDAKALGLAFVPEDRKGKGLVTGMTVAANVVLPSLPMLSRFSLRRFARENRTARDTIRGLRVRCSGPDQMVRALSGGNQQKVVIGKWLATKPRILLLDEPTRGIDVGAKQEIYDLIFALAAEGMAIVVVSSEMPEILALADCILVMCEGRPMGTLTREEATEARIMHLASPSTPKGPVLRRLPA